MELAAWFDRWLRPQPTRRAVESGCDVFVRASTVPEPDLDLHEGYWVAAAVDPADPAVSVELAGHRSLAVMPDTGTAAWIDCAGHLPWGLSTDQRLDDARSLTWDVDPPAGPIVGQPRARLRVSADAPAASLSVKLCDVFPDGTSALVSRGTLDLAFRDGVHGSPSPLVPGHEYDVVVDLDACAYEWSPGNRLRVSVAGSDWPNTVAPPAPVTITTHGGSLVLPVLEGGTTLPRPSPPGPSTPPRPWRASPGRSGTTCSAGSRRPARTPCPTTTPRTTATPARTTAARSASTAVPSSSARTPRPILDLTWPGIAVQARSVMD